PGGKVTKEYHCIPRLAYDPLNDVVLCIAWLGEKGHETWAFDVGKREWKKMAPATEPIGSKSRSRNLDFDAARNLFLLQPSIAKTSRTEMWMYGYGGAKPIAPPFGLSVTTEAGRARLTWDGTAKEYQIERAEAANAWETRFERIATAKGTSFTDKG